MLTYQQCEDLIFESYNRVAPTLQGDDSVTRDLTAMRWFFAEANLPLSFAPTVTITGSKGKGSTAILCASILQGAGHKVGLLTSPHFLSHRERIRVNSYMMSEEMFVRIVNHLAPIIRRVDSDLDEGKYLSPTGLFLAVAVQYFLEQDVTAVVLEVGRGGRYDDVSLIENQVSCLTPIMPEHLEKLGPDIEGVARHKVGVIKANNTVISAPQSESVMEVIEETCQEHDATLHCQGETFRYLAGYQWDRQDVQVTLDFADRQQVFQLLSPAHYQAHNIALAYAAAVALDPQAAFIDPAIIKRTRLPGRCDMIRRYPRVFIDGAINRESARSFLRSVLSLLRYPAVLITALPADKDYQGLLHELMPHMDKTIITQVSAGHLTFSKDVVNHARTISDSVLDEPDVGAAFDAGLDYVGEEGTLWVVGTQSLVRDALSFWDVQLEWLIVPEF